MQTLKILAALLHYPEQEIQAAAPELRALVAAAPLLQKSERRELTAFLNRMEEGDLLDLQSEYVATFDRGRKLSLHLFEHVHCELQSHGPILGEQVHHGLAAVPRLAVNVLEQV